MKPYTVVKLSVVCDFFSFVIGAPVTSPDVITQIAVAIPVCLLYEVDYLVVKYILRR